MRTVFGLGLLLALTLPAWAQTVRIDGVDIPYLLVDGQQVVERQALAEAFPGFPGGEGSVNLSELVTHPKARVVRRDGLIVSVRYYDQKLGQIYQSMKPTPATVSAQAPPQPPPARGMNATEAAIAQDIIRYSNLRRSEHGVGPLVENSYLLEAAVGHSSEMIELGYFSHDSPNPERRSVMERVKLTGVNPRGVGENIHTSTGFAVPVIAQMVVDDWMDSPGHRRNLLDPTFHSVGIGVISKGRKFMVTQVLGAGL